MNIKPSYQALNDTVITYGFCVGCGVCAVPEESPFEIIMDEYGQLQSRLNPANVFAKTEINYESLCPFGAEAANEDIIADKLYAKECEYNPNLGYYTTAYAGYVTEGDFRKRGSSGGMGSWVLNELLEKGLVDHILHVKSDSARNLHDRTLNNTPFKYHISNTIELVQQGGKSRYYPIELSGVLHTIRHQPGRYAVIGLPCFIKSIRLLQAQEPVFAERIQYCVGLVCGHLKSARYAESLAWQMGITPESLQAIDFRVKVPGQPANRYSTYARGQAGEKMAFTHQLLGTDWGAGAFKYKACDYCDDVFAETADIVLGDAWLPEYIQDNLGTNLIVTRQPQLQRIVSEAEAEGRLKLDEVSIQQALQSQDAGLRHRKIGIIDRIGFETEAGIWTPTKRVAIVDSCGSDQEQKKQQLRIGMRDCSHESFKQARAQADIDLYLRPMERIYLKYKMLGQPFRVRAKLQLKRVIIWLLKLTGYRRT